MSRGKKPSIDPKHDAPPRRQPVNLSIISRHPGREVDTQQHGDRVLTMLSALALCASTRNVSNVRCFFERPGTLPSAPYERACYWQRLALLLLYVRAWGQGGVHAGVCGTEALAGLV
jgi:hypothetical protein